MSKRTIIYARVSTDEQADKGYSLPSQLELCRKYAERLGFSVVAELSDDYSGATPVAERPKGKELVALLKERKANALVVYCVDRLSRDIVDLLASVRDWLKMGVEVHTCDIGKIESELDIVLVIKGWQGSDERQKIRERTTRGRNAKAKNGKVIGSGKPPYGYSYVIESTGGKPTVVGFATIEPQAEVIRLIYRWYVSGEDETQPMVAWTIARRLSKMGIATPTPTKTRAAGMWNENTVNRILTSEVYAGIWRYGKAVGNKRMGGKRPIENQIAVSVPPIVERELWEAAQHRRERNSQMNKRNCKREYLLRGICHCGKCNSLLSGRKGSHHLYYACSQMQERFAGLESICKSKYTRADALEAFVWNYLFEAWEDKSRFENALYEAQREEINKLQSKHERIETIDMLLKDTEREAAQLAAALAKVSRGIVGKTLEAKVNEVERRYTALSQERDELQASLTAQTFTDESIQETMRFREEVLVGMRKPTFEDKRHILEMLRVEVTVTDGQAWAKCVVPIGTRVFNLHTSRSAFPIPAPDVWSPPPCR